MPLLSVPPAVPPLTATNPPLVTGGSVIRVPPWPSEVTLKFADVYEPTKVRVMELFPSLTVSVPLALAPEVCCIRDRVLLDVLKASPPRSIPSPRWKPEMVPTMCALESSCNVPPLEKTTPLAEPPDATSSVPPLTSVATAVPPLLTSS